MSVKWQTAIVCLNDVIVFSNDAENHSHIVDRGLRLMSEAGMTLKPRNCYFSSDKINHLGHVISPGKLELASEVTEATKRLPCTKKVSQTSSFLGLCNEYHKFVPNFPTLTRPLKKRLKESGPARVQLHDSEGEAVDTLTRKLTSKKIMAPPRMAGQFAKGTNTPNCERCCVLFQQQDEDSLSPIRYWAVNLNPDVCP